MSSRKQSKQDDSGNGSTGRTSSGRTKRPVPAPSTMNKRVVHAGVVLEVGDLVPSLDSATLARWRRYGWVD